jgi:hypothetical protein
MDAPAYPEPTATTLLQRVGNTGVEADAHGDGDGCLQGCFGAVRTALGSLFPAPPVSGDATGTAAVGSPPEPVVPPVSGDATGTAAVGSPPEPVDVGESSSPGAAHRVYVGDEARTLDEAKVLIQQERSDRLTEAELTVLEEMYNGNEEVRVADAERLAAELKGKMAEKYQLSDAERDAIDTYQGGAYKELNKALREGKPNPILGHTKLYEPLLSGIDKLPKTNGLPVRRTLSFATREEFMKFTSQIDQADKVMTTPQFDSTSRAAKEVSLPDNHAFAITLQVSTKGHHGAEISSVLRVIKQSESETLFPPGTRYKVTTPPDIPDEHGGYNSGKPFKTIATLEELEEPDQSVQQKLDAKALKAQIRNQLLQGLPGPSSGPSTQAPTTSTQAPTTSTKPPPTTTRKKSF